MIARPRTWSDGLGYRSFSWGRFKLDTSAASPRRWTVRRTRLGYNIQTGGRIFHLWFRRTALVAMVIAAVTALVGCGGGGTTPLMSASQVCVTAVGHVRVDDFRCAGSSMAYDWWYLAPGVLAPAIGQRATVGTATRPRGSVRTALPATPTTTKPKSTPTVKKQQATPKPAKPAAPKPKPAAPKVRTR